MTEVSEETAERIAEQFQTIGHLWKFDDGLRVPTSGDVKVALDKMLARLYDEDFDTRLEMGGIVMDRLAYGGYDIYVIMDTIYEEQND